MRNKMFRKWLLDLIELHKEIESAKFGGKLVAVGLYHTLNQTTESVSMALWLGASVGRPSRRIFTTHCSAGGGMSSGEYCLA